MSANTEREASRPINRPPRTDMTDGRRGTVVIERHQKKGVDRVHGRLIDLSRGGVKIAVDCCIPFDETITLTAEFPEIQVEFRVLADVLWSRQADGDTWLIGCCFKPGLPNDKVDQLANEGYLERRCSPRYPISCDGTVRWEQSDESVAVRVADFSAEGFCIVSPTKGKTGQRFHLELEDNDGNSVQVAAHTCWYSNAEDGYLVGAEYLNRNDSHRLWEIAYQTSPNQPLRLRVPLTPSRWMVAWFAALIAIIIAYPPLVRLLTEHDSVAAEWSSDAAAVATDRHLDSSTRPAAASQALPLAVSPSPAVTTTEKDWQADRQRQQAKLDTQTRDLADRAVQLTRQQVALQRTQAEWERQLRRRQSEIESQRLALLTERSAWVSKQRAQIEPAAKIPPADAAVSPLEELLIELDPPAATDVPTTTAAKQPQLPAVDQAAAAAATPPAAGAEPQPIQPSDQRADEPADASPLAPAEDAVPTIIQEATPISQEAAPITAIPAAPIAAARPTTPTHERPPTATPPTNERPPDVTPLMAPGSDESDPTADPAPPDVAIDIPQQPSAPAATSLPKADPKAALAALRRGRQQLETGRYADAVGTLQEVVQLQPQNPLGYYLLALAYYQNGDPTAAEQHIWTGAELEQHSPIANWGAVMQRYQGRPRLWLQRARVRAKKDLLSR